MYITFNVFLILNVEYWDESDSELNEDFPPLEGLPDTPQIHENKEMEEGTVWWIVAFTCVFQGIINCY